jgi:hypothetical protein
MNTSSMTNQAQTDHEHAYYRQDPKKALRTYLEVSMDGFIKSS